MYLCSCCMHCSHCSAPCRLPTMHSSCKGAQESGFLNSQAGPYAAALESGEVQAEDKAPEVASHLAGRYALLACWLQHVSLPNGAGIAQCA